MHKERQSGDTAPDIGASRPLRVLVADPHPIARWGLRRILEAAGAAVVGESATRPEAIAAAEELRPDMVVIDAWLAQGDARFSFPSPETTAHSLVIVLGPPGEPAFAQQARRQGADAFLPKNEAPTALARTVAALGCTPKPDRTSAPRHSPAASAPGDPDTNPLAVEEATLLHLLAWGYNTAEVAARLGVGRGAAETMRAHLMEKLAVRTRAELVRVALRRDLMGPPPN